jgi:hypothetical protein
MDRERLGRYLFGVGYRQRRQGWTPTDADVDRTWGAIAEQTREDYREQAERLAAAVLADQTARVGRQETIEAIVREAGLLSDRRFRDGWPDTWQRLRDVLADRPPAAGEGTGGGCDCDDPWCDGNPHGIVDDEG